MLESKLWHNKTKTNNVKVAKMVNLSKLVTNTLASLILVFFCWEKHFQKLWFGGENG